MDVRLPNGTILQNVPEGTSKDEIATKAIKAGLATPQEMYGAGSAEVAKPETSIAQDLGNLAAGAVRGAGSIGATLLAPYDVASDLVNGKGLTLDSNRERRTAMDAALQSFGADPESGLYKTGKIGTEIAGTLPIGGLLGKGAQAIGLADPVAASIASGGFSLGRPAATGILGKVGDLATRTAGGAITGASQAGLIDPSQADEGLVVGGLLPGGVKAAGVIGSGLGKAAGTTAANVLGAATGTGAEAVTTAFNAGKAKAGEFLDNMRGNVGFDEVVDMAKQAVSNLRASRQSQYRSGMVDIANDKTVLDFAPIDTAMQKIAGMGSYKGVKINSKSAETVNELADIVSQWKSLDPAEYHTPEGLDALKQAIGEIRDSTQYGTPARVAADKVYHAVKLEITKQAPTYSKVMADYSRASELISEVERSLSLGNKSAADTAVRKLQSLMRNNVQTSYGNRLDLARTLEEQGGKSLLPAIAGQSMSSWMPRGMTGSIEKVGIPLIGLSNPTALLAAPFTSPRLMGEALYGIGRAGGLLGNAGAAASGAAKKAISPQTAKALARSGLLYSGIPTLAAAQRSQQ